MDSPVRRAFSFPRLAAGVLLAYTSFGVLLTAILPLVELDEGGGPLLATMIVAAPLFAQTLGSFAWGWISDRWGRRGPPLVLGTAAVGSLFVLYPLLDPIGLLAVRIVQAGAFGSIILASATATEEPTGGAGPRLGTISLATYSGNALGILAALPFLGGAEFVLRSDSGWALSGLLGSLGLVASFLFALAGEPDRGPPRAPPRANSPGPAGGYGVLLLALATLVLSVGRWNAVTLVPIYLHRGLGKNGFFGLPVNPTEQLAFFTLVASVANLLVSPWTGRRVEGAAHRRRILIALAAGYAATWVLVAAVPTYPVVFFVWTVPLGVFLVIVATREVAARTGTHARGTAVGLWTAAYNGGGLLGGALAGTAALLGLGISEIFAFSGALSVVALALFAAVPRARTETPPAPIVPATEREGSSFERPL
jgi:MFS family permease